MLEKHVNKAAVSVVAPRACAWRDSCITTSPSWRLNPTGGFLLQPPTVCLPELGSGAGPLPFPMLPGGSSICAISVQLPLEPPMPPLATLRMTTLDISSLLSTFLLGCTGNKNYDDILSTNPIPPSNYMFVLGCMRRGGEAGIYSPGAASSGCREPPAYQEERLRRIFDHSRRVYPKALDHASLIVN